MVHVCRFFSRNKATLQELVSVCRSIRHLIRRASLSHFVGKSTIYVWNCVEYKSDRVLGHGRRSWGPFWGRSYFQGQRNMKIIIKPLKSLQNYLWFWDLLSLIRLGARSWPPFPLDMIVARDWQNVNRLGRVGCNGSKVWVSERKKTTMKKKKENNWKGRIERRGLRAW